MNQSAPRARRRWVRPAVGLVLAAICLAWVFHDIHPEQLLDHIATIQWSWIALAVVLDVLSYVAQGWRWQLLLRPLGNVSTLSATEAIYVGLFANEILPLRVGELIRMYLVARRTAASFAKVIPSVAVERLFDGVWLAIGIGLTAMFIPLPKELMRAADVLGLTVVFGTLVLLALVLRRGRRAPRHDSGQPSRSGPLASALNGIVEGLSAIQLNRRFFQSFAISSAYLSLQAGAFWLVMWGYGLTFSPWVGFAVLLIVHLGTAIPNAPANVGTYQFFTVLGLGLFGVEKTLATGFSVVVFVVLTVPLWVLGLLALARSGTSLSSLRDEARRFKGLAARGALA